MALAVLIFSEGFANKYVLYTQELMWQISNGVDLENEESKKHLLQK